MKSETKYRVFKLFINTPFARSCMDTKVYKIENKLQFIYPVCYFRQIRFYQDSGVFGGYWMLSKRFKSILQVEKTTPRLLMPVIMMISRMKSEIT